MKRLDGKVAIITGAAAGIGEATARLFAEEGAKLALLDVVMEPLEKVVAELNEQGGNAIAIQCNVASEDDVVAMVKTTMDQFGQIVLSNRVPQSSLCGEYHSELVLLHLESCAFGIVYNPERDGVDVDRHSVFGQARLGAEVGCTKPLVDVV